MLLQKCLIDVAPSVSCLWVEGKPSQPKPAPHPGELPSATPWPSGRFIFFCTAEFWDFFCCRRAKMDFHLARWKFWKRVEEVKDVKGAKDEKKQKKLKKKVRKKDSFVKKLIRAATMRKHCYK
ncbi:unnamed protein product [Blepharisma stoltei]|uniref:Uncharacterized protein n=1 Tax=Blepharisma stoltei TaxID=1481888 RepID=A0AAU9I9T9_9CILI|nr:unnamed protein product [Blepharisma stoltei]